MKRKKLKRGQGEMVCFYGGPTFRLTLLKRETISSEDTCEEGRGKARTNATTHCGDSVQGALAGWVLLCLKLELSASTEHQCGRGGRRPGGLRARGVLGQLIQLSSASSARQHLSAAPLTCQWSQLFSQLPTVAIRLESQGKAVFVWVCAPNANASSKALTLGLSLIDSFS